MSKELKDKVALVTGAGRGIGRAIAERLGAAGALIAVNYARNADAAKQVVAAIEASGGRAFAIKADISEAKAIEDLFEQLDAGVRQRNGAPALDILVNNAGQGVFGGVEHTTVEGLEAVLRTNVQGTFLVAQQAIRRLRPDGRIVSISSAAARRAEGVMAAYSMSKAAVESLTVMLARDLGSRRITVNAVAPGWTETDINAEARKDTALVDQVHRDTLFGRFGKPADIADVVEFLVSPSGKWVTGQVIEASGGYQL
jgi:3-oxoacyl-[acyl-carrier protein] reductase